nr:conotoxin precursor SF-mi2 [Conus judaeus]UMA83957.1 conotoxin precursor SF-mi2 [Conus judaeus]DAZ86963.1 TPA_inf: conotoxin precursor SF-mi2 [Conus judaeus]
MRFYLLLTVTLLLALSTGGDAEPRRTNGLQKHFVRRDCRTGCVGCGNPNGCCCGGQVCVNGNHCEESTLSSFFGWP